MLHILAKPRDEQPKIPPDVLYQMLVTGFIVNGIPLSTLQTQELKTIFGYLIAEPATPELMYNKIAFSIEQKILEDVRRTI